MTKEFSGKTAVVTGAGSGIGREIALALANEGANIIVSDIDSNSGKETVTMLEDQQANAQFIRTDVRDASEVQAMVRFAIETYGQLDIACNNAGVGQEEKPLTEISEEEWSRIMDINLKGVWLCMKYQIPELVKQPTSAMVNTASIAAIINTGLVGPYSASKHGVIGLTKTGAMENVKSGLRVNAVCPGIIKTPILNSAAEYLDALSAHIPMGRLGKPEEIANAVLWLCSDKSSYVNGHALVADGAFTVP